MAGSPLGPGDSLNLAFANKLTESPQVHCPKYLVEGESCPHVAKAPPALAFVPTLLAAKYVCDFKRCKPYL